MKIPEDIDVGALHRTLVTRLTADLRPVQRLWSPWIRLALWVSLALLTVAFAAAVGLRDDLARQLGQPHYVLALAILLAGAGLAATVALLTAVPGRIGRLQTRRVCFGLLVLAVAVALLGEARDGETADVALATVLRCTLCVGAFGLLAWLSLFWAVRRAAPLDGWVAGLAIGAAAFFVGAASVRVACPVDGVLHLALSHGLPVALWTAASTMVGTVWLTR